MLSKNLNHCFKISYKFCTGPLKTINPTKAIGKLTILPTPIGNLQDLSPNIIKALFKADVIGCEDRRVAGKLYTLIKSKNIIQTLTQQFGEIGLHSLIPHQNDQTRPPSEEEQNHRFYNYSNMNDKGRKKFLRKMQKQQQQKFKIDYLKYRALKIMNNQDQLFKKQKQDKYDQLYGLDSSDLQHIELQIRNTRIKKGRGVLIPLNTYSQTKMFDIVRMFLETKNVAIISDAGMPCISDPGWKMVKKIRQTHPQIPIQVIGGPSSVSVMTLLASMSSRENSNSLNGRFEGFAPQQISNMTDNSVQIQTARKEQFSIHFINSKKLRKKALELEKFYGQNHRILLANQLTKLYQRKYHGKLSDLNSQMSKQNLEFEGIGQLSYLFYPERKQENETSITQDKSKMLNKQSTLQIYQKNNFQFCEQKMNSLPRLSLISIHNFIDSIKQAYIQTKEVLLKQKFQISQTKEQSKITKTVTSKDLIELICTVFGIKSSQAKKIVYEKDIQRRNKLSGKKQNIVDTRQIYQQINKNNQNQNQSNSSNTKRGRRGGRNNTKMSQNQKLSPEQQMFLKQLQKNGRNMF